MKMRLSNSGRDICVWQMQTVRTPHAFGFDYPERKLRQPLFDTVKTQCRKIEVHGAFRFGGKLFRHERVPASHGSPIDVTLRFTRHIGADSCKVIAFSKLRLWPAVR